MTRPKHPIMACCIYCREEFSLHKHNQKWHDCPEAIEVKRRFASERSAAWKNGRKMKKGRFLREEAKGHRAKCGHVSPNYWRCNICLQDTKTLPDDCMGYPLGSW